VLTIDELKKLGKQTDGTWDLFDIPDVMNFRSGDVDTLIDIYLADPKLTHLKINYFQPSQYKYSKQKEEFIEKVKDYNNKVLSAFTLYQEAQLNKQRLSSNSIESASSSESLTNSSKTDIKMPARKTIEFRF
jgi:hypothetical protein